MEFIGFLVEILPTIGFPILCVGALAWFVYKIYTDSQKANAEREEKLYIQLGKQTEINERFANIIAQYEIKLDTIQTDISEIKTDIAVIMSK